jgi:hypothetical protein
MPLKNKTTRITLDLPTDLHGQIKTLASQRGETLRQLFIELASTQLVNKTSATKNKTVRKLPAPVALSSDRVDLKKLINDSQWPEF